MYFEPIDRFDYARCVTVVDSVKDQSIPNRYSSNLSVYILGRIQDLTKGGSDKRPPEAVVRRGVRGHAPPENF